MSSLIISLITIVVLIAFSALISASEVAFYSLGPNEKDLLKNQNIKSSALVLELLSKPQELLATILIANNFVNVAIVIVSSSVLYQISDWLHMNETLRFILEIGLITFIILMFGEVIPKVYATKNGINIAKFMARPMYLVGIIPPFSWLKSFLAYGTVFIQKYAKKRSIKISSDELEQALALTKEESTSEEEHKILEGIIKFGNTEVKQIMKSRMEVEAFEIDSSFKDIQTFILNAGYSRIPIYKKNFDDVVGILYIKDLLPYINESENFNWKNLIRKPFFVPENKKIDDLLKEFQIKKMHMAIVVDEYGGTNGLITLEDVLEEIIGDITDEFDDEDILYVKKSENEYVFEGRTSLIDFYKTTGIDNKEFELKKGDSETISGFIIENEGRILRNKEYIVVDNVKLIVEAADKKRIKTIRVILNHSV